MIYDTCDEAFLKLCGLCRYIPTGLQKRYDSPIISGAVISNLREHKLIKKQSNNLSYKLSWDGQTLLENMGYQFPTDARMNLKRPAYMRKLKNAEWNVLLYLAGIDVFGDNIRGLNDNETGFVSSLMLRADTNIRVLAGTRFLGILRLYDTAYIPYYMSGSIIPSYEREIFNSQLEMLNGVTSVKLILSGENLGELWEGTHPQSASEPGLRGLLEFDRALGVFGYEYLLVPFGRGGVMQMNVMRTWGYRETIARTLGCDTMQRTGLSECDGILQGIPYIIAIDFNVDRILRALKQVEIYNKNIVPKICCLPFQKPYIFKLLNYYDCQKSTVVAIDKENICRIFPKLNTEIPRKPYRTKEGKYIEVTSQITKAV